MCPFCLLAGGIVGEQVWSRPADLIYRDDLVLAFVAAGPFPGAFGANYPGHVLIVPLAHIENIYDLPDHLAARIHALARRMALALKAIRDCQGTSTRQHNEPAGNQDVWHFHLHVFPRWQGGGLYSARRVRLPDEVRATQAARLRLALLDVLRQLSLV
ncbi:HIT family protein [Deinococcus frigens]|uniref:HIT family protein n=1 Tax=Deinococcus frigens TaxID=249403 RepID=UPI000A82071D|nr:HIT family protein [Deinococcus frigens]